MSIGDFFTDLKDGTLDFLDMMVVEPWRESLLWGAFTTGLYTSIIGGITLVGVLVSKSLEVHEKQDIVARISDSKIETTESTIYVNAGTAQAPVNAPITTTTTNIEYVAMKADGTAINVSSGYDEEQELKKQKLYRLNVHKDGFGNWHLNSAVEASRVETEEFRREEKGVEAEVSTGIY